MHQWLKKKAPRIINNFHIDEITAKYQLLFKYNHLKSPFILDPQSSSFFFVRPTDTLKIEMEMIKTLWHIIPTNYRIEIFSHWWFPFFEFSSLDVKRTQKTNITFKNLSTISFKRNVFLANIRSKNFPDEQKHLLVKEIYKESISYKWIYKFICIKV